MVTSTGFSSAWLYAVSYLSVACKLPACLPTCLAVAVACLFLLFLQDAITRANLYADAGADAIYVEAPISKQELAIIGQKVINFFDSQKMLFRV